MEESVYTDKRSGELFTHDYTISVAIITLARPQQIDGRRKSPTSKTATGGAGSKEDGRR